MNEEKKISNEDMDKYIESSFSQYTAEKAGKLIKERYNPTFNPVGFMMYIQLIEFDIKTGKNGFTDEIIQASPIHIFNNEIIKFAIYLKGKEFASEVEELLKQNRNDFPNFF